MAMVKPTPIAFREFGGILVSQGLKISYPAEPSVERLGGNLIGLVLNVEEICIVGVSWCSKWYGMVDGGGESLASSLSKSGSSSSVAVVAAKVISLPVSASIKNVGKAREHKFLSLCSKQPGMDICCFTLKSETSRSGTYSTLWRQMTLLWTLSLMVPFHLIRHDDLPSPSLTVHEVSLIYAMDMKRDRELHIC